MRKFILLVVLVWFVAFVSGAASGALKTGIEKYTVHITSISPFGMASCSGTVITNTDKYSEVLTCKHCIASDRETIIEGNKVVKIITSSGEDLAIFIVEGKFKGKEVPKFAIKNEEINKTIYMFGRPGFVAKYLKKGKIAAYTSEWGWAKLEVNPGCSGSGLFNEKDELIGVVWGAYTEASTGGGFFTEPIGGTKMGIFTPLDKVQKFLKKVK